MGLNDDGSKLPYAIIVVVGRRLSPTDFLLSLPLRLGFLENVYENPHKPTIYVILTSCFNLPLLFRNTRFGHP